MIKHFVSLEWKSFFRKTAFKKNLAFKIFTGFFAVLIVIEFAALGGGSFYLIEELIEKGSIKAGDPFEVINKFLIYWFVVDLGYRYMLQKMPVANIKPMLYLPFSKGEIVKYAIGKMLLSFFNILPAFFFVPFSIVLLFEGFSPLGVLSWYVAAFSITWAINFINIFMNNLDKIFYPVLTLVVSFGFMQYYDLFDITVYTQPVFQFFYDQPWSFILPVILVFVLGKCAYRYFKKQLYLDAGLKSVSQEASTENLNFLDRFGSVAIYLKNDIKLIKRNKRARMTFFMGFLFAFYGLIFTLDMYGNGWQIFAAIFCTGGFLLSFGGFVPSWDSSYYKLMMSQNIPYRDYLLSKWWLMVVATAVSIALCSFYIFVGWDWWFAMLAAGVYNIGFNSSVVLWSGAFVKTPIDLTSTKKAFGDSKAFNLKTFLFSLPKIVLPVVIFYAFAIPFNDTIGFIALAIMGVLGLLFRNKFFDLIEKIYKNEKYDTIAAYSQKD